MKIRRKGVAIVDTKKGILLVAKQRKIYNLPGGGAERGESRKKAAVRELYEETGLKVKKIKYLFNYLGNAWQNKKGKTLRNYGSVFLVKTVGIPKPQNEIKYLAYWKPNSKLKLSQSAKKILQEYTNRYYHYNYIKD